MRQVNQCFKDAGLKIYNRDNYKSWSSCIHLIGIDKDKFDQRKENSSEHIKAYNKTVHPTFAPASNMQKIGMGMTPFFHGSTDSFQKSCETADTSRLRVEYTRFFKSIEEEQIFLSDFTETDKCDEISGILENNAHHFVRLIPFAEVWNAYWSSIKEHLFVFQQFKVAIVYFYDDELCKFVGPLADV